MSKNKFLQIMISVVCAVMLLTIGASCKKNEETTEESSGISVVESEYLYKDGISEYVVLISNKAGNYESFAADELVSNLQASTGRRLPIVTDKTMTKSDHVISLGHTALYDKNVGTSLATKGVEKDGYYIITKEKNIYISCLDNTGGTGVLYGVYDFLHDTIGYEYYDKDEIRIESKKDIPLLNYQERVVNPSFEMRMLRNANLRDDGNMVMRYRMVYPSNKFGMVTWGHGQLTQYILPNGECTCGEPGCGNGITRVEHHPEWFSNYGTKDAQLCWTAGESLEQETARVFIDYFQKFPEAEYFMFGQEDNISTCNCDNCKRAMREYGCNSAGLQIAFMNNVIKITNAWLAENKPGRRVKYIIYAYYGTEEAPVKTNADGSVSPYSDKVIPDEDLYIFYTPISANYAFRFDSIINSTLKKNLGDWSVVADGQIIMYLYDINFRHYLVNFNNFGTIKGIYEMCKEYGVSCMTAQAADSYTICFQSMRHYVESKLMWNLDLSYDELARDFMANYYKDAADDIYAYYQLIRDRYAYYQNIVDNNSGGIYGDIKNSALWTQPVVQKIDECFDRAMSRIAKYKDSDPELYETLETRIMRERLSSILIKLTIHSSYYTEEELETMREQFKYYVNLFKLSEISEGDGFGYLID